MKWKVNFKKYLPLAITSILFCIVLSVWVFFPSYSKPDVTIPWDGTVLNKFAGGNGTDTSPYLITDGSQLAYLATSVNSGTTYEGQHFQLTNDIDLAGLAWTPIGTYTNSFRGIFDGAGHSISNAIITTKAANTANIASYGIFGSIGGGTTYTEIKNIELINISIKLSGSGTAGTTAATFTANSGYHIGFVVGTIYNDAKVTNCIVNNSSMATLATLTTAATSQVFLGGIAGSVGTTTSTDPGEGHRYSIQNCYVSANIQVMLTSTIANSLYLSSGGIVGRIHRQPVWPENSLYKGIINTNSTSNNAAYGGYIGPIFGSLVGDTTPVNPNNATNATIDDRIFSGNDISDGNNLTMTSYYTGYTAKTATTTFNNSNSTHISGSTPNTTTYRIATGNSTMARFQGVNKGIYTTDMNAMLTMFNTNLSEEYVSWAFENGSFTFLHKHHTTIERNGTEITANIEDEYNIGSYSYSWYLNDELQSNTEAVFSIPEIRFIDYNFKVITYDGSYYGTSEFLIKKSTLELEIDVNYNTNVATANFTGELVSYIDMNDYTFEWYIVEISGDLTKIDGADSLILAGLENGMEYRLVATNNRESSLSLKSEFLYGNRTVIYVSYQANASLGYPLGVDTNNGLTPQTPVRTLNNAYTKISSAGTTKTNIIVIMGNYTSDTTYLNSATATTYNRQVTITGTYKGISYNPTLSFNSAKYLTANTTFQYITLTGSAQTIFYLQGRSLTMGEGVVMTGYQSTGTSNTNGLLNVAGPDFHIVGGYFNYNSNNNTTNIPYNNSTITINSGTYARIIAGNRNDALNTTSRNVFGKSSDPFNVNVVIDIKNSTTSRGTYPGAYDVNLLVGGQTDGSIYANSILTIKDGNIGRILGGSIGYGRGTNSTSTLTNGYPSDSFFGSTTIEVLGGRIQELFGGSLGRLGGGMATSQAFFYGSININVKGGIINTNIYGAGAGGVTGYDNVNATPSDSNRALGLGYTTQVNINVSGGTINGNIYGAGYGYSDFLSSTQITTDGGTLYGKSNINISGGTINGSIFGAGRGTSSYGTTRASLAQMYGDTSISITGNQSINGNIYAAGDGVAGLSYLLTARLTGTATVSINNDLNTNVYGGGNIAQTVGNTYINVDTGHLTGTIYGGGNVGDVNGKTNVNINGGQVTSDIYGGGQSANVTTANIKLNGGKVNTIFGGSNISGTVNTSNIATYVGTVDYLYGGNNQGGITASSNIAINGGEFGTVYGGGNIAETTETNVIVATGDIDYLYGGGNQASVSQNTIVEIKGGTINNLFGGSNTSGDVPISEVKVNGGIIGNVFGGNNVGGSLGTANVYINGGTIEGEVYGGGNAVATTTTNLYLNDSNNKIPLAFGGGKSANVATVNIYQDGASIDKLFGGSNTSGDVSQSNLNYLSGTVDSVYGGNNEGGRTVTADITVTTGTINTIYGGGNKAATTTSSINIASGSITNIFGGGNEAGITNTSITINGGNISNIYGGSNNSGTVTNSMVTVSSANAVINKLYGGNNAGGNTENPNILIIAGSINEIYGGGNKAIATKTTLDIRGGINGTIYGGGNEARVDGNTTLIITSGMILNNIYGGGNYGRVGGSTNVNVTNATIGGSLYAGGNGQTAIVEGNTTVSIGGNTTVGSTSCNTILNCSVFGGGNAAATGLNAANNSVATVNVSGGSIYGNVYGGANTSVVYGMAKVNIGYDTISGTPLSKGNIYIKGTIFGGGEANASGSEIFDYSFISVTSGIDVQIDGNGHNSFSMTGSIFGSGNASSAQGASAISIKNYGEINSPQRNISIQRTDLLTIDNSAIILSGASDRTNEYSDVLFTLSIIGNLRLKNNSTLFLETGTNLLRRWESIDANGNYATVSIDDNSNSVNKNVDNRVYLIEGKNLNIATNENVTSYGEVFGMTFFGMYTYNRDNNINMGIYDPAYNYGDSIDWGLMPVKGSYILGLHKVDHNIEVDGFYSHYMNTETSTNKISYITPTPEDSNFYMWIIGEAIIEYNIDLVASKYSTLGTAELTFLEFSKPNTSFQVLGFDDGNLEQGISLIDSANIPKVAPNVNQANTVMGLSMKSGNSGWLTKGETKFLTSSSNMIGTTLYVGENSTSVPSLLFYLYHSKNLTETEKLGSVQISVMAVTRIDALTVETERLIINVNISSALFQTNEYEGSMTAGREYSLFASTVTNINSSSSLSAYYSLYTEEENFYKEGFHRALVSTYILPLNTKITMIDFVDGTPVYYYHIISETDVTNAINEHALYGEASYKLSLFKKMGSTHNIGDYNDELMNDIYYNDILQYSNEEFIFILSFEDAVITSDSLNNSLVIELRDDDEQTIVSVLGIQRLALTYNIYANKDAIIGVEGTIDPSLIYMGQQATLSIKTNFSNARIGANVVHDTRYFDSKLGINITILDKNGQIVNGTSLLGVKFIIDGVNYYPNIDGTTRVKIADRVGNVSTWLIMDTENATLPSGSYTLSIESFGSPDGIYYGSTPSDVVQLPIEVINEIYGLNSIASEHSVIFDAKTGLNQLGTKTLSFDITYHSGLENPNIRMRLLRRVYDTVYDTEYKLVDLKDYVDQILIGASNQFEYVVINNPNATNRLNLQMKSNLLSGTYKIDFCLYDGDVFIGKISRYIIIK